MKSETEIPAKKHKHIINLFMEAIAYRVPLSVTKVIVYADDTSYPICPRCSLSLDREYVSFCDRCGQELNWDLFACAKICHPVLKRK